MATTNDRGGVLSAERQTRLVGLEDYCALLTSRRNLERANDPVRGFLGLLDPESGVRYMIDERDLLRGAPAGVPAKPR